MQKSLKLDATQNKNLRFLMIFVLSLVAMLAFEFVSIETETTKSVTCTETVLDQDTSLVNS